MSTTKPIPPTYVPVLNDDGMMTRQWYEYFQRRDKMSATDLAWQSITIANGSNAVIATAGQRICFVKGSGDLAIYNLDGNSPALVSSGAGLFVAPTTAPGAGKASISTDGSFNFRIYNNMGAQITFTYLLFNLT